MWVKEDLFLSQAAGSLSTILPKGADVLTEAICVVKDSAGTSPVTVNAGAIHVIPLNWPGKRLYGTTHPQERVGLDTTQWPETVPKQVKDFYSLGQFRVLRCAHKLIFQNPSSMPIRIYYRLLRGDTNFINPSKGGVGGPYDREYDNSGEWQTFVIPAAPCISARDGAKSGTAEQPSSKAVLPIDLDMRYVWGDTDLFKEPPAGGLSPSLWNQVTTPGNVKLPAVGVWLQVLATVESTDKNTQSYLWMFMKNNWLCEFANSFQNPTTDA